MPSADFHLRLDALSDALHRALADSTPARCWVFVDASLPTIDDAQFPGTATDWTLRKIASPHFKLDDRQMPYLVELDCTQAQDSFQLRLTLDDALMETSIDSLNTGHGRRICGWLSFPEAVDSRASMLRFVERVPKTLIHRNLGRTQLLRWFDPAVLWTLWTWLDSSQRNLLLGSGTTLHLLDPRRCYAVLFNTDRGGA